MRDGAIALGRKFGYSVAKSSRFTILMKMLTLTEGYSLLMVPFGAAFLPVGSVVLSAGLRYVVSILTKLVHTCADVPNGRAVMCEVTSRNGVSGLRVQCNKSKTYRGQLQAQTTYKRSNSERGQRPSSLLGKNRQ